MAEIYSKSGEHVLILGVRELYTQPFEATGWTDLRIGWFLSLTDETADDTITALGPETIAAVGGELPWTDRFAIGCTNIEDGSTFYGFTNGGRQRPMEPWITLGSSALISSDIGIGVLTSDYWRPTNGDSDNFSLQMIDGGLVRVQGGDGSQVHFPQANIGGSGPAGYATLLTLRFTRPNAEGQARIITMSCNRTVGGHSGDVLFTSDPSKTALQTQLESFPTTVQTLGPVEMAFVPSVLYMYWPFAGSRLRLHCYGILKKA